MTDDVVGAAVHYVSLKFRLLDPGRIHVYKAMPDGPDNWWVARWLDTPVEPTTKQGIAYSMFNTWAEAWAYAGRITT